MNDQLFSIRNGFSSTPKIQEEEVDECLTNSLWNVFDRYLKQRGYSCNENLYGKHSYSEDRINHFCVIMIEHFLRKQIDIIRLKNKYYKIQKCKDFFYEFVWYEKYNFIEFFLKNGSFEYREKDQFIQLINSRLERENSAYRLISDLIVPIINKADIDSIDRVLSLPELYENVKKHLRNSLLKLSDKQSPDYKNSIKESICSVETLFREIFTVDGDLDSSALSEILKKKDRMPFFHAAMIGSIDKLYAFTSDVGGIRHGNKPSGYSELLIDKSDAIFVIIYCSALISYVISKKK